jgi:hypothetical protein
MKVKNDASSSTADDVAIASHHTSISIPIPATATSFIPPSNNISILKTTDNNNNNNNSRQSSPSRQRRRRKQQQAPMPNGSGISIDSANKSIGNISNNNSNTRGGGRRRNHKDAGKSYYIPYFVALTVILIVTIQLVLNNTLHNIWDTTSDNNNNGKLRKGSGNINDILLQDHHDQLKIVENSYDVLLKNTINYNINNASQYNNVLDQSNNNNRNDKISNNELLLQQQIDNMRSEISNLESKSMQYVDDPRFFPFVIRDSRHLTPTQINHDFHIFDYVDLTQAKQPKSKHSQLFHNARLVVDDILENKRSDLIASSNKKARTVSAVEPNEAPCQYYSVKCYRQKILQVFSYVERNFPNVEYYFYIEADNDLCVPMTMVKDLALTEKRYFINIGIGFSGWIMSRSFLTDFIQLYGNTTLDQPTTKIINSTTNIGKTEIIKEEPEIRPDVLASYYLTDRQAWAVTRQYWVSHTTLESLGIASLTVKDRRKDSTGERMKLDKHLPRCLEPRRGKWKVSRRKPFLDPRDRFGWDYFDYDVCPNALLFPCGGPDQLQKSIAEDWRIANETGALAKWKRVEEAKKKKEAELAKKAAEKAAELAKKAAEKAAADARKVKELEESKKKEEVKKDINNGGITKTIVDKDIKVEQVKVAKK